MDEVTWRFLRKYVPCGALGIFSLLSAHIPKRINNNKISEKIPPYIQHEGFKI